MNKAAPARLHFLVRVGAAVAEAKNAAWTRGSAMNISARQDGRLALPPL